MPIARITPIGGDLYHVHVMEAGHPDQGLPGGGNYPSQGLPGFGSSGQRPVDPGFGRPGFSPGHPDQGLPGGPNHPSQGLPGNPNFPDNSLPSHPPPVVAPGTVVVMVRQADGKWHYAAIQPGSPPPRPLPEPPYPDQGLPPGAPGHPDQGLPPSAQPKR